MAAPHALPATPDTCYWGYIDRDQAPVRGPGVHILTGPVAVKGAAPGDTLVVTIHEMTPRLRHGSNCAANWGLLYDVMGKERITIYELEDGPDDKFPALARPSFGFDFNALPT